MSGETPTKLSPLKRRDIIDALRIGAVPRRGYELFAEGLDQFKGAIEDELASVAAGAGRFKAVRGDYGAGKTFFARWVESLAREKRFATTLVQISETETPLYRMETIYRRAVQSMQTSEWSDGAFRSLVDGWFYQLEEEVLGTASVDTNDAQAVSRGVGDLLEKRLAKVSATQPQFAAALRGAHGARLAGDHATSENLVAWLMGETNVGAASKRYADIKGELDHRGASGFIRGLLELLRQTNRAGLVLVLDEVETIQRVPADRREKSLNALRQFIDDLSSGFYPGLYVMITGTPAFFDGPQGVQRLPPLAQRLATDFDRNGFDNPRMPQIRLRPFDIERMKKVGAKVRSIYPTEHSDRIASRVNDGVIEQLARGVAGKLGGKTGIAPRTFLRKLIDLLDKVDLHENFDPQKQDLVIDGKELNDDERAAAGIALSVDDIAIDITKAD